MSETNLSADQSREIVLRLGYKLYKATWPISPLPVEAARSRHGFVSEDLAMDCIKAAEAWVNVARKYEGSEQ